MVADRHPANADGDPAESRRIDTQRLNPPGLLPGVNRDPLRCPETIRLDPLPPPRVSRKTKAERLPDVVDDDERADFRSVAEVPHQGGKSGAVCVITEDQAALDPSECPT